MDHIRTIQEVIDENKEAMPTNIVRIIMDECQKAYISLPKLWKLTYVHVIVDGEGGLDARTKTMILEEVAENPRNRTICWHQVIATATIPPVEMHANIQGDYSMESKSGVHIVKKVEPFLKRARE